MNGRYEARGQEVFHVEKGRPKDVKICTVVMGIGASQPKEIARRLSGYDEMRAALQMAHAALGSCARAFLNTGPSPAPEVLAEACAAVMHAIKRAEAE